MSINVNIVDQRVRTIVEDYQEYLPAGSEEKQRSAAFVLLCIKHILDMEFQDTIDCLVEGGDDAGIDGIHIGDEQDNEFPVSIFQGKYKKRLDGESAFPENSIVRVINTMSLLFEPDKGLTVHSHLQAKMEEVRSLIRDGYLPVVRIFLCNNGKRWVATAHEKIEQSQLGEQVSWHHCNHDTIVRLMQAKRPVDTSLQLVGKAIVEDFNFRRVLIGKLHVSEIKSLFDEYGDKLLERNVRRYLGQHHRVNRDICQTLLDADSRQNFYFFNNGITMICNKFSYNALQGANYSLQLRNLQIINGGQTCKTIQETIENHDVSNIEDTYVMVRLYEIEGEDTELVREITYATNSQNPVDLRDLRSNDEKQRLLEASMLDLGYHYRRYRDSSPRGEDTITSSVAAEATLAIWRRSPHQAKFRRSEHFGKLYHLIFDEWLNATQVILGVLVFRYVEKKRKRPEKNAPRFLPYSSHFLSMLMGDLLLGACGLGLAELNHINYAEVYEVFESRKDEFYEDAINMTREALEFLYGEGASDTVSLQRLSATFRRGDLLEYLNKNVCLGVS